MATLICEADMTRFMHDILPKVSPTTVFNVATNPERARLCWLAGEYDCIMFGYNPRVGDVLLVIDGGHKPRKLYTARYNVNIHEYCDAQGIEYHLLSEGL